MISRPVVFANKDGLRLFGIADEPEARNGNRRGVVLLSPGTKYRVAPHRLYVKLSRNLVAMGFTVLRFDFAGLGDSEGRVEEAMIADFHGTVQSGRYVEDTRIAMDWMEKEYGISRFVLAGLCGGAITGLLAGALDRRVAALVALGLPVLLDSTDVDPTRYLTGGELDQWKKGYLSRLTSVESWLRLVTLRSNYRVIFKVVAGSLRRRGVNRVKPSETVADTTDNFNPLVPGAFETFASRGRMLLIFGEADRLFHIYEERLARPYGSRWRHLEKNVDVHVVRGANHVFSLPEWQHDVWERVSDWLRQYFG